jgi:ATP synthase protein I
MSQDSERGRVHRTDVQAPAPTPPTNRAPAPVIDPAARAGKRLYQGLSASSAGLELGVSVGLGALFGAWLDGKLGTAPWLMVVFLVVGVIAGFRGVLRAVARADREDKPHG